MKRLMLVLVFSMIMFTNNSTMADDSRFALGLTHVSGLENVMDIYESNMIAEGHYAYSEDYWPVGISFHSYTEYDNGFGFGGNVGPLMIIYGGRDFSDIPVGLDFRYTFFPEASITPYVRVGGRYHIVSGSYVEDSIPGFFGGIGVDLLRNKKGGMGIEISYDASEIELVKKRKQGHSTTKRVRPGELMFSIYILF